MGPAEQVAADHLAVPEPARPQQAEGLFGEQPVPAGIGPVHQPDRLPQQIRGHRR